MQIRTWPNWLQFLFYAQLPLAVIIYSYAALKPASDVSGPAINPLLLHFTGNILLSLSSMLTLARLWPLRYTVILLYVAAIVIEYLQYFVPSRTVDLHDIAANVSGITVGLCLASALLVKFERSK